MSTKPSRPALSLATATPSSVRPTPAIPASVSLPWSTCPTTPCSSWCPTSTKSSQISSWNRAKPRTPGPMWTLTPEYCSRYVSWWHHDMAFRIIGSLWRESTGHWFPSQRASNATLMWNHCSVHKYSHRHLGLASSMLQSYWNCVFFMRVFRKYDICSRNVFLESWFLPKMCSFKSCSFDVAKHQEFFCILFLI